MKNGGNDSQVISHHMLRMLIGINGIALPVIVFFGRFIPGGWSNVENSISDYYYTEYRDIFVGILFVLGFFLLSYRGKDTKEDCFANSGFFFSLGTALFPCRSDVVLIQAVHYISAVSLFAMFAVFSLWLFRRSFFGTELSPALKKINIVYIVTGTVLVACCVFLIIFGFIRSQSFHSRYKPILITESAGLFTFAYAWFTRAHFLWRDRNEYKSRWHMFGKHV